VDKYGLSTAKKVKMWIIVYKNNKKQGKIRKKCGKILENREISCG